MIDKSSLDIREIDSARIEATAAAIYNKLIKSKAKIVSIDNRIYSMLFPPEIVPAVSVLHVRESDKETILPRVERKVAVTYLRQRYNFRLGKEIWDAVPRNISRQQTNIYLSR